MLAQGGRRMTPAVRASKRTGETNVRVRTPLGNSRSCTQSMCSTGGSASTSE
ncbi:Uncharacterised protein [Bordetella pertussis]|nr:Uncharacterised protein [Bordetella pertussis]CFV99784.1 Uncharacterised protein [Bordetella pertussis]